MINPKGTRTQKIEELKTVSNLGIKFEEDKLKVIKHYYNVILNLEEIDLVSFLNREIEPSEILDKKQTKETICNNLFLQILKHRDTEITTKLALELVIDRIRVDINSILKGDL
jgi:hypothetical protein